MLQRGLILDQGLAPFGFLIFIAKVQSQLSRSVVILLLKIIALRAIPVTRMREQSAQVSPVWSVRVFLAGKLSVYSQRNYKHMDHSL